MHKTILLFFILVISIGVASVAHAGFGISPPFLENGRLTPGAHYEQKVMLVRNDASEERYADICIDVPGAEEWISIRDGEDGIHMPVGVRRVPMIIQVDVLKDAKVRPYEGGIDIIIKTSKETIPGSVGVSVGAQIDVRMAVTEKEVYDFELRGVSVDNLEEPKRWLWFYFPGRIMFHMRVENTGNKPYGPSGVELDIYDITGKRLLEQTKNTNSIPKVAPFKEDRVAAVLPTWLRSGSYRAHYRIFDRDELVQENDIRVVVLPVGSLTGYAGYGFAGLHARDKFGVGIIILILTGLLFWVARFVLYVKNDEHSL